MATGGDYSNRPRPPLPVWASPACRSASEGEERRAIHQHVLHPVDPALVSAWQNDLSSVERTRFEALVGDSLTALGYR